MAGKIFTRQNGDENAQSALGSSPSGFTTRVTKVHVVCESETRQQAKPAGLSRDHFGGARQIHTSPLRQKKWPQLKKKCSNWVYIKLFFSCIELNEIVQNFTNFTKFLYYYVGVLLASWEKKPSYNDGGNSKGAGSCLRPLRGLADEI